MLSFVFAYLRILKLKLGTLEEELLVILYCCYVFLYFSFFIFLFLFKFVLLCMQVLVTSFSEVSENEYIDPRTAQVAVVDHVKQVSCSFFKLSAS